MKKALLIFAAALFAAAGLYAEGQQDDPAAKYRNQVTLTGTLQFADGFPVISADGKTYNLHAPRLMREAYSLKPGTPLTVEGFIVQSGPAWQGAAGNAQTREAVFVRKVTIDGKTFETGSFRGRDFDDRDFREWGHRGGRRGEGFRGYGEHRGRGYGDCGGYGEHRGRDWRGRGRD